MLAWLAARNVGFMDVVLIMGVLFMLWVLWRVQRSPKQIDLVDLLLDTDGKASWTKITAIGAYMFASWGFAYLVMHNQLTPFYFGVYIVTYSASPIAYKLIAGWIGIRTSQPTQSTTLKVETQDGTKVSTETKPTAPGAPQP